MEPTGEFPAILQMPDVSDAVELLLMEIQLWLWLQAYSDPSVAKPVAFVSMRGRFQATVPAAVSR